MRCLAGHHESTGPVKPFCHNGSAAYRRPMADVVGIRPFTDDDRADVLLLADRLCEGAAPWRPAQGFATAAREWLEDAAQALGNDARQAWVAVVDEHVVGFAAAHLQRHFSGPLDAYLGELVVDGQAEGRGVGRRLVAAVEAWARAAGAQFVTLETGAANARARGFYRALGYAEEQVQLTRRL